MTRRDERLDDEIAHHIDQLAAEYEARGMSRQDARYAARRAFGSVQSMKERYRDRSRWAWVTAFWQDVRYALRSLRKNPAFATVAIASLTIGIGANTAIFTLLDTALLRDLAVEDPSTLVAIQPFRGRRPAPMSYPIFRDLASGQRVLSDLVASGSTEFSRARLEGRTDELPLLSGNFVSANYFRTLGVPAALGRTFTDSDSRAPGEGAVAVVSYRFWDRLLNRDPQIVGRTIVLDHVPFMIVGVMPRGFSGERIGAPHLWVPILMQPRLKPRNMLEARTASWFRVFGRLAPGVDGGRAASELTAIHQQLMADEIAARAGTLNNPGTPGEFRIALAAGTAGLNMQRSRMGGLQLLMGAVGVVLLIVCCNLANLLMVRATAREREIAIRLAIGASRRRLVRQLLTESFVLSAVGGTLGFLLTRWTIDAVARQVSLGALDIVPDARTFAFTAAVSVASAMLFGLVPALQATWRSVFESLQGTATGHTGTARRSRVPSALVVAQVALSLWLLVGGGLLLRSLANLSTVDIGVDRQNLLTVRASLDPQVSPARIPAIRDELADALARQPGVAAVALSAYGLFLGSAQTAPVRVPGSPINPEDDPDVRQNYVSSEYFQVAGIALVAGRGFTAFELSAEDPQVVVINESMARYYFGRENPLGKRVVFPEVDEQGRYIPFGQPPYRGLATDVVGVVRDGKYDNLREGPIRMAYLPLNPREFGVVYLRTSVPPSTLFEPVRELVMRVDPGLSARVSTLEDDIAATLANERLMTRFLTAFGAIAALLAAIGLYGVVAYTVSRRTNEIGIRIALGARRPTIVTSVIRHTLLLASIGVAFGMAAAYGTTHLIENLLFGLTPTDLGTIAMIGVVMLIVATLAGAIPAMRAARVDAMRALRTE